MSTKTRRDTSLRDGYSIKKRKSLKSLTRDRREQDNFRIKITNETYIISVIEHYVQLFFLVRR